MRPLLLLPFLLLTACGHLANANQKARAEARERELKKLNVAATSEADSRLGEKAAGEVVRVDATGEFVLIRARNGVLLAPDQELECRGKGGGRIRVTPERLKVFFAADVMSGTPAVGDAVIPVRGTGRPAPKLTPLAVQQGEGGVNPVNTIHLNPGEIRPEDIRPNTLDDVRGPLPVINGEVGGDSMVEEPPLPDKAPPLLPGPDLSR
jgi:hypothetical protein